MMRNFYRFIFISLLAILAMGSHSFAAGDDEKSYSPPPADEAPIQTEKPNGAGSPVDSSFAVVEDTKSPSPPPAHASAGATKPNSTGAAAVAVPALDLNPEKSAAQHHFETSEIDPYLLPFYFFKSHEELNQLIQEGKIDAGILLKLAHYTLETPFLSEVSVYFVDYLQTLGVSNFDEFESRVSKDPFLKSKYEQLNALKNSINLAKFLLISHLSLEKAQQFFENGKKAFQEDDWTTALPLLQKASDGFKGAYENAKPELREDIQANWAHSKYLIARCHFHLGNYENAVLQMQLSATACASINAIQIGMWFEFGIEGQIPRNHVLSEFYYRIAATRSSSHSEYAQRSLERLANKASIPANIPVTPVFTHMGSALPSPWVSPVSSPAGSPVASPVSSPAESPVASPVGSPATSPMNSPKMSPFTLPAATGAAIDLDPLDLKITDERNQK